MGNRITARKGATQAPQAPPSPQPEQAGRVHTDTTQIGSPRLHAACSSHADETITRKDDYNSGLLEQPSDQRD
jgi:hypothetical protein